MTRRSDFLSRLRMAPVLPQRIAAVRVDVTYTSDATARAVPARISGDLEWPLADMQPLFAAGFGADQVDEVSTGTIQFSVTANDNILQLKAIGAAHRHLLVYCMLALLERISATPVGAYEYLLDMMEGDEEAAREAFNPKLITDIADIVCSVEGDGPEVPFAFGAPPLLPALLPLLGQISDDDPLQTFALPSDGRFPETVDHGFMVLQNNGVFLAQDTDGHRDEEPEIFLSGPRTVTVSGWGAPGEGLAELLWLIAGGQANGIYRQNAE